MTLSIPKTYIHMNTPYKVAWTINDTTVEEVLVAKYLRVQIRVNGCNLVGLHGSEIVKRAQNNAFTTMNLTHTGLDRALIACTVWEVCASPAILYCMEAMCISQKTLNDL